MDSKFSLSTTLVVMNYILICTTYAMKVLFQIALDGNVCIARSVYLNIGDVMEKKIVLMEQMSWTVQVGASHKTITVIYSNKTFIMELVSYLIVRCFCS